LYDAVRFKELIVMGVIMRSTMREIKRYLDFLVAVFIIKRKCDDYD